MNSNLRLFHLSIPNPWYCSTSTRCLEMAGPRPCNIEIGDFDEDGLSIEMNSSSTMDCGIAPSMDI